jgi:hypothetical protein
VEHAGRRGGDASARAQVHVTDYAPTIMRVLLGPTAPPMATRVGRPLDGIDSPGRQSHRDTASCIPLVILHTKIY